MNRTTKNIVLNNKLKIDPIFKDCYICLALSSNNKFIKYTSVLIKSIIDNSNNNHNYDIIILHSDISKYNMDLLSSMIENKSNFSIRFVDITNYVKDKKYYIETNDKRLTEETYYRIYLLDILSEKYDKVIYLDGDMVTEKDVYELELIDIENIYIAAVRDFLGIGTSYKNTVNGKERKNNRLNIVKIKNINDYFIAGLLIINLKELRKSYNSEKIEQIALERSWLQHDQDVLNYVCRNNKAKFIDANWNVLHDYGDIKYLPPELLKQYRDSEKNPYIIHYGGSKKPWKGETSREKYFWFYAIKSPFILDIIDDNPTYLLKRKTIDYDFFENSDINEIKDREMIKEYILNMLKNKADVVYGGQYEIKQEKIELLRWIETRIKLYKKYAGYLSKEDQEKYAIDIYNKIKTYRKHAITKNKDFFTTKNEKRCEICSFLLDSREVLCKQKIIGYVGMLEYTLLSKGTYLSWIISMFPYIYYEIKDNLIFNIKLKKATEYLGY